MDGLTLKQRIFVKGYIEQRNGVKAALIAYNTRDYSTAGMIASENLKKPKVVEVLNSILNQEHLTEEFLVKRLKQIIEKPKVGDGVSVSAMSLIGRWRGYNSPKVKVEPSELPKSSEEIDAMLKKIRKTQARLEAVDNTRVNS
jgi:phage terminase small subunit